MNRFQLRAMGVLAGAAVTAMPMLASAGITLYEEGNKSLEIGGRLQPQYRLVDGDNGDAEGSDSGDDFFLRRMRFYIEGTLTENIYGIWQVDFGDTSDDPEVKDAFINYSGLPMGNITVGNAKVPFSRELLTSSKRQQFVERTVVGDHNYGVPDRQMGVTYNLDDNDMVQGSLGIYQAGIDPSFSKVDFESRVSSDAEYFGNMVAGRIDWTPLGKFKMAQGAFGEETKFGMGLNAFTWNNDDDISDDDIQNQYDTVNGYGVDAGFRSGYFSADAAVQYFDADTIDGAASSTGLVDENGDAKFSTYLVKAGYMVVPSKLEFVAGFSALDPDDGFYAGGEKYDDMDKRYSAGLNYFFNKHDAKIQLTYEIGRDVLYTNDANGQVQAPSNIGGDQNTLFLQFQQVL
ncbi:phosphate-selective porin O and P [Salinisphaera sp. T5B8]|uniref:porin n=1 Tax=Salinisphaera sp. T5B8 TaxID=1304154 RepID=UPI003340DB12